MKTLLLIRHAKSSWDHLLQDDFERPLNERGKADAPMMAERLLARKVSIDAFISSPAKRARKTCSVFLKACKKEEGEMILKPELYLASADTISQVVSGLEDRLNAVALFSHNPGITEFANLLTEVHVDNMPTCSVYAVKAAINHWSEFGKAAKTFWFFDYPKNPDSIKK